MITDLLIKPELRFNTDEIQQLTLFQPPFLFLTEALVENENGKTKIFTKAEIPREECTGHYSEVPLVHICRVMAQTGSLLVAYLNTGFIGEVVSVEKIKVGIRQPLTPPITLLTSACVTASHGEFRQLTIQCWHGEMYGEPLAEIGKINFVLRPKKEVVKKLRGSF